MAVTPVSLGPSLRAWALAGVTHILCDGPVASASFDSKGESKGDSTGDAEGASLPRELPRQRETRFSQAAPPSAPPEAEGQALSGAASGSLLRFAPANGVFAEPAAWPEPWKGWFAKIAPAPVLWTYHELGADLTGIGRSAERSAFFKNLLAELGLPKGNSVFWPSAMPAAHEGEKAPLRAQPAVFSAGLSRLNPQFVIVFGETALEDIGLAGRIRPFRQEMVEGKLLLCLPEIEVLLHNQGQRASSASLLRAVLQSSL